MFIPGSAEIVSAAADSILRVFDLRSNNIGRPNFLMQGHTSDGIDVATAAGGLIASSDSSGKVLVYDIFRTGARRLATMTVPDGVSALQFVMGGKYLVCS